MSERDFFGTWTVSLTAGTPFGAKTRITITEGDPTSITFDPPVSGGDLEMSYVDALDMLQVQGIEGIDSSLFLAVYLDPEVAYRSVYGVATVGSALVTFAAAANETLLVSSTPSTGSPVSMPATFIVRSASGCEFGLASRFDFRFDLRSVGEEVGLTIVDVIGRVLLPPALSWVSPTTLRGLGTVTEEKIPMALQCSFVELGGRKRCFGISVVGDPENSGVWGADEEEPPAPGPEVIR